jgi:carboxymethylenebutenolidase
VPFYGVPAPEKVDYTKVTAPILAHFAKHDAWAKAEKAEAIAATVNGKGGAMTLHVYDAGHAFVNDTRPDAYDEPSATLAWSRTVAFFHEHLG